MYNIYCTRSRGTGKCLSVSLYSLFLSLSACHIGKQYHHEVIAEYKIKVIPHHLRIRPQVRHHYTHRSENIFHPDLTQRYHTSNGDSSASAISLHP